MGKQMETKPIKYIIQGASANDADRYDKTYPSDQWHDIVEADSIDMVLSELLTAFNDSDDDCNTGLDLSNGWVRLVTVYSDHVEIIDH